MTNPEKIKSLERKIRQAENGMLYMITGPALRGMALRLEGLKLELLNLQTPLFPQKTVGENPSATGGPAVPKNKKR